MNPPDLGNPCHTGDRNLQYQPLPKKTYLGILSTLSQSHFIIFYHGSLVPFKPQDTAMNRI